MGMVASRAVRVTAMPSRLGVVVVNWNNKTDTLRCVASVMQSDCSPLILVVDNGSTDGSAQAIQQAYPDLPILRNADNLGFTGGYNIGIRHLMSRGVDHVLLINNDAIVEPYTLSALSRAAISNPQAGFLGAKVCALEEPHTVLSAGGVLCDGWKPVHRGMGAVDMGQLDALAEVDFLSGCALLVSRRAIEATGMLDEKFFAYYEDVEWCYRGKKAGFKVLFVPEARVLHPDTRQRDEDSPRVTYYLARNSLLFAQKHHLGAPAIVCPLVSYMRTLLSWTLRSKWRHKRPQRDALARGIWDFARGRWGQAENL